jgi:hypothetical protein
MEIDAALIGAGQYGRLTQAQCSKKWGLGRGQLSRHVNNGHISKVMAAVQSQVTILHGQGLLTEIATLYERAQNLMLKAENAYDLRTAVSAVREARGCIETFARIGLALAQGEDAGGDDRPDLDQAIDDALNRRAARIALEERTSIGHQSDQEVVEAEVVPDADEEARRRVVGQFRVTR